MTSAVSNSVSSSYLASQPAALGLNASSPEVLLAGYRVAGWVCLAVNILALALSIFGFRNLGIVGKQDEGQAISEEISLGVTHLASGTATPATTLTVQVGVSPVSSVAELEVGQNVGVKV